MELPNDNYVLKIPEGAHSEIHTPGNFSFQDIRQETLDQTDQSIVRKSTYPNGFVVIFHQSAKEITIVSNAPLVQNPDGSYTAPTDVPLSAPDHG